MEGTSNYVQIPLGKADDTAAGSITFYATKVKCPYSDRCIDFEKLCGSCRHNKNRSFYEPDYPYRDYYPWYPYYPYYPNYPYPYTIWYTTTTPCCDSGDDLTIPTTSCYEYTA